MASVSSSYSNPFADSLRQMQRAASKATFNLQFNQIQNTAIKRLNKEVQAVLTDPAGDRKRVEVDKDIKKYQKQQTQAADYLKQLRTNMLRLDSLQNNLAGLILGFSLGDQETGSVTQKEADTFNKNRDAIVHEVELLVEQRHPSIVDGDVITRLHHIVAELKTKSAEPGPLEDADSAQTNDNGAIDRLLDNLSRQVGTAIKVSDTTKSIATNLLDRSREKLRDLQVKQIDLNQGEAARRKQEIEEIKARYANMLRAIELSFDAQSAQGDFLANNLTLNREPDPGSVLNLFA